MWLPRPRLRLDKHDRRLRKSPALLAVVLAFDQGMGRIVGQGIVPDGESQASRYGRDQDAHAHMRARRKSILRRGQTGKINRYAWVVVFLATLERGRIDCAVRVDMFGGKASIKLIDGLMYGDCLVQPNDERAQQRLMARYSLPCQRPCRFRYNMNPTVRAIPSDWGLLIGDHSALRSQPSPLLCRGSRPDLYRLRGKLLSARHDLGFGPLGFFRDELVHLHVALG